MGPALLKCTYSRSSLQSLGQNHVLHQIDTSIKTLEKKKKKSLEEEEIATAARFCGEVNILDGWSQQIVNATQLF